MEESERERVSGWRHGIWRVEVTIRIRELRHRLSAIQDDPARAGDPSSWKRAEAVVKDCLETAEAATERPRGWDLLSSWWTGSAMTTAWESVHEADLELLSVEDEESVRANLPRLRAWIQRAMDDGDRKRRYEMALRAQARKKEELDAVLVRQAFKDVIVANNERYASLRAFRNNLIVVTGVLTALILSLAFWHFLDPNVLTLCSDSSNGEVDCLDGSTPQRGDVALVVLVGAIGGLLAIAFGLAERDGNPSRFDPKVWQALLKPIAGAATALIAVLLIQADILLGPADSRSESLLLAYAAVFGFSQQLLTRFIDQRAGTLIGTEGKEEVEAEEQEEPVDPLEKEKRGPGTAGDS